MATIKSKKRDKVKHSAGGRGAKKGGKGGHFSWGHADDDVKYLDEPYAVDTQDPNYSSGDDPDVVLAEIAVSTHQAEAEELFRSSVRRLKEFKKSLEVAAREYLNARDADEFVRCLLELESPEYHGQVVKILISFGFDQKTQDREAIGELLNQLLSKKTITHDQLIQSFNILINRIPDIVLDVPQAADYVVDIIELLGAEGNLTEEQAKELTTLIRDEAPDSQEKLQATKARIKKMFEEYFVSETLEELFTEIGELESSKYHPEVVKQGVSLSLDRHGRCRELVSQFLAHAAGIDDDPHTIIGHTSVERGFDILLNRVGDLHNDVPDILSLLSYFIARAISDEAIAPAYLDRTHHNDAMGAQVLDRVRAVIKERHHDARLSKIWGPGDGRSVAELKDAIRVVVLEYFSTADKPVALKSVREIDAPYFHHEVVKQLFSIGIDRDEKTIGLVIDLIKSLIEDGISAKSEIEKGLRRIEKRLPDTKIDVPAAPKIYEQLKKDLGM